MVLSYIKRIRNVNKQRYAMDYAIYLQENHNFEVIGDINEPDYHTYNITCMAAQVVRTELYKLMS